VYIYLISSLSCQPPTGRDRSGSPMDVFDDTPDRETLRLHKFGKLLAGPNTDLGWC